MTRHAIAIAACLALLGQQGDALAQSKPDVVSVNFVVPGCRESVSEGDRDRLLYLQGMCLGIVGTVFYFSRSNFGICTPDGANVGQAVRAVILYIDQRPARLHERFEDLSLEALQQAWPCRR